MTTPVPAAKPVTQSEVYGIFTVPAHMVDKFYACPGKDLVRVTLAEGVAGTDDKIPRYSMVLTWNGLAELGQLVTSLLNQRSNPQPAQVPEQPQKEDLN